MSVSVRPRPDSPRQCPFCRDNTTEDVAPCACGVIYHPECRAELSRCATLGCAGKSGQLRGAHRDVACARCNGLINNDGDMCLGCWSPFHRRCLAEGCCLEPPAQDLSKPRDDRSWQLYAAMAFSLVVFFVLVGGPIQELDGKLPWFEWRRVAVGAVVLGVGAAAVGLRRAYGARGWDWDQLMALFLLACFAGALPALIAPVLLFPPGFMGLLGVLATLAMMLAATLRVFLAIDDARRRSKGGE